MPCETGASTIIITIIYSKHSKTALIKRGTTRLYKHCLEETSWDISMNTLAHNRLKKYSTTEPMQYIFMAIVLHYNTFLLFDALNIISC